jgi:hypothetical protein
MTAMKNLREEYHRRIFEKILFVDDRGIPNNADKYSKLSVSLAKGIFSQIKFPISGKKPSGQTSGKLFEEVTEGYLEKAFAQLQHLRPGNWIFSIGKRIEDFEQYEHLADLSETLHAHKELRATLGDYLISPDIVVGRMPVSNNEINLSDKLLSNDDVASLTPLRLENSSKPLLHASISCKWTIRSDRAQNVRTEGLNLIRNRKGNTPHIVIVTAEPYPQRIASLALGTGDIDCVYHFALPELQAAASEKSNPAILDMLDILISGKRLRDISDLPFDLAI